MGDFGDDIILFNTALLTVLLGGHVGATAVGIAFVGVAGVEDVDAALGESDRFVDIQRFGLSYRLHSDDIQLGRRVFVVLLPIVSLMSCIYLQKLAACIHLASN